MAKMAKRGTKRNTKRPTRKLKDTVKNRYAGAFLADSKRDIVVYDHPTKPGKFLADPFRVLMVAAEGPHTVRIWNQTEASDVRLTLSGTMGGKVTIEVDNGQRDDTEITTTHSRRKISYKIRDKHITEPEASGGLPVLAASDPQIIIE